MDILYLEWIAEKSPCHCFMKNLFFPTQSEVLMSLQRLSSQNYSNIPNRIYMKPFDHFT